MADKQTVKLTLTPEQREQLKQATGKEVLRLRLDALEARLAPGRQLQSVAPSPLPEARGEGPAPAAARVSPPGALAAVYLPDVRKRPLL